jgi:hypothetical protein
MNNLHPEEEMSQTHADIDWSPFRVLIKTTTTGLMYWF